MNVLTVTEEELMKLRREGCEQTPESHHKSSHDCSDARRLSDT